MKACHSTRYSQQVLFFTLIVLCTLPLAACGSPTSTVPLPSEPVSTQTSAPPATPQRLPTFTAPTVTPEPDPVAAIFPRTQYTLTAILNYDQHYLAVDEQIVYTNNNPETLNDLVLMVDALYYPGVFSLKHLTWQDGAPIQNVQIENGWMRFPLPTPMPGGSEVRLSLSYELRLPAPAASAAVRPIPFGYTQRQANLVDWYPFIPPYSPGQGWLAHPAGYFGEHLVYDISDFSVNIHLGDSRPALVIAASAAPVIEDGWYRYRHSAARNFVFSVSPEYEVRVTTVGAVTVMSYFSPIHKTAGQAVLDTTARALALYNKLYGPYPRQVLSVVEADFLDGMEYDGLYFLSNGFYNLYQGTPGEYLIAIAAHETAHQWFYALVGNDQALQPWLDEAWGTYSERLFYENTYPEALPWWWEYRVRYYDPQGAVDGSIYNPAGYRAYRDAIYLNGALFLEDLRTALGDPVFFGFIQDYISRQSGKISTYQDFFAILREHTLIDPTPLINKYFAAP